MKTKAKLASESEKLEFALGEIDILTKQLQREKDAFEKAYVDTLLTFINILSLLQIIKKKIGSNILS